MAAIFINGDGNGVVGVIFDEGLSAVDGVDDPAEF